MYIIKNKNKLEIKMCNNILNRFMGFMFKKNITYGLCFPKCNSIHTFFMKENIDVIMCDKNNKILYFYQNLKKNKIILPKKNVSKVYETPSNFFDIKINDKMKVSDN